MVIVTDRQRTSATINSTFLHLAPRTSCSKLANYFRAVQKTFAIRPVLHIPHRVAILNRLQGHSTGVTVCLVPTKSVYKS